MRAPILAPILVLVLASATAQAAGIYQWKDARGVTHYSDVPPPNTNTANVQPDAAARVAAPTKPDPRCATARANIQQLKSGRADIGLDADGDGRPDAVMTEAERGEQLRQAEAAEKAFCPAPAA